MFYQYCLPKIYEIIYREIKKANYGFKKEKKIGKNPFKKIV